MIPLLIKKTALLCALIVAVAASASAFTRATINIDGHFQDWSVILADAQNYVLDGSPALGDPDMPPKAERDLRVFAFTFDADNLYAYFKRTKRGHVNAVIYVDLNDDGVLDAQDVLIRIHYHDRQLKDGRIFVYNPAGASDPLTGDGVDEPGSRGTELPASIRGFGDDDLLFEAAIPWTDLGVSQGAPLCFHPAMIDGNNMELPKEVEDNADAICNYLRKIRLEEDRIGSTGALGCARYSHVLRNLGNLEETVDLRLTSSLAGGVSLFTDPDGNGDPSDGTLVATDLQGNGSFNDAGDFINASYDSNFNDLPDFILQAEASVNLVVEVCLPGSSNGDIETTTITAQSDADPLVQGINYDVTYVGAVAVFPDRSGLSVDNSFIEYQHTVCNNSGQTQSVSFGVDSSRGWSTTVYSDPDGDGSRLDGAPITETQPLSPGACVSVVLVITVPAGEPLGVIDETTLTAALTVTGEIDTATDATTVAEAVTFVPDNSGIAAPGDSVFYQHFLTNGRSTATNFELSAASTLGSTVTFWSDPNRDSFIDDGFPITTSGLIPPWGGSVSIVVQVDIPGAAGEGDVDNVLATATAVSDATVFDAALDTTVVRNLVTYADPLLVRPSMSFPLCVSVYARAHNLRPGDRYRFVWYNSQGLPRRISLDVVADAFGRVDDVLDLTLTDAPGTWLVKVQRKTGATDYEDVTPGGSRDFEVIGSGGGGTITLLGTDSINYTLTGDTLLMRSILSNFSPVEYRNTLVDYIVFQDSNGNDQADVGEFYILLDGTSGPFSPGALTCSSSSIPDLAPSEKYLDESCFLPAVTFPSAGIWTLCATWYTECGTPIDSGCTLFNVGCAPADMPIANAGTDQELCRVDLDGEGGVQLGEPGNPAFDYEWFPVNGLNDPFSPNPTAAPQATTTYTLTVTDPVTGCVNSTPDCTTCQVTVTVLPNPEADAGPSQSYCSGEPGVTIGTPAAPDRSCSWQPSTGLADAFACETLAAPGVKTTYTLTVTDDLTGCTSEALTEVDVDPLPTADSGGPGPVIAPVTIGTGPCDPALEYIWSSEDDPGLAFLSNPTSCTPTAIPEQTTEYCLVVRNPATGCESPPNCVGVVGILAQSCAGKPFPAPIVMLRGDKAGANVRFDWSVDADALDGYHVYRVSMEEQVPTANADGVRVIDTAADPTNTYGSIVNEVPGPDGRIYYYQVVGVCLDGLEGPI